MKLFRYRYIQITLYWRDPHPWLEYYTTSRMPKRHNCFNGTDNNRLLQHLAPVRKVLRSIRMEVPFLILHLQWLYILRGLIECVGEILQTEVPPVTIIHPIFFSRKTVQHQRIELSNLNMTLLRTLTSHKNILLSLLQF